MAEDESILYKKELDSLRKADYAYSKELLAFSRKNPKQPIEDLILASAVLIHDAESFHINPIPVKSVKHKTDSLSKHPLEAWSDYEKSLSKALELDGIKLDSTQLFIDGHPRVRFAYPILEEAAEGAILVPAEIIETDSSSEDILVNKVLVEDESSEDIIYVKSDIELVSDEAEMIDDIDAAVEEPFAFEPVGHVAPSIKEEEAPHLEGKINVNLHKDYSAPEELTVDNSIHDEDAISSVKASEKAEELTKKEHTIKSKGFDLKSKKYEAPEELTVDNTITDDKVKAIQDVLSSESSSIGAEIVETLDSSVSVETDLTIPNKEYVAPDELNVDNSLSVSKIVINSRPEIKNPRKGLFSKKAKPSEYAGVTEETLESEGYTRSDILNELDLIEGGKPKQSAEEEKPVAVTMDERALAEANEYIIGSNTDFTVKSKDYEAPAELVVDNSIPSVEVAEGSENAVYVETVEHVLESETEIKIKSKKYEAPEELTVDNSLPVVEQEEEPAKKRGRFGRKESQRKAQPVVFLPPKPIAFDLPEDGSEGYTYTPKNTVPKEVSFDEFVSAAEPEHKDFNIKAKIDMVENIVEEELEVSEVITAEKVHGLTESSIDFDELAAEIAKEKTRTVHVVYDSKAIVEDDKVDEFNDEDEDIYLLRSKETISRKTDFDTNAILKDIKIIDI